MPASSPWCDAPQRHGPVTVPSRQHHATVTPPSPHTDTETETKTHVRTAPPVVGAPPAGAGPATAQDVVALWNATVTPPIPRVAKLTSDRKRKIEARLKTYPDLETWRTCIEWLNGQDWCRAPGTGEHGNWTATLDWLTKKDGEIARTLERVSAEEASPATKPPRPPPEAGVTGRRAENFCQRYGSQLYPQFREVAYVVNRPVQDRDLEAAERLCTAYTDAELDQLAETFLQIPNDREPFLKGKTRTISMLVSKAAAIAERLAIMPASTAATTGRGGAWSSSRIASTSSGRSWALSWSTRG